MPHEAVSSVFSAKPFPVLFTPESPLVLRRRRLTHLRPLPLRLSLRLLSPATKVQLVAPPSEQVGRRRARGAGPGLHFLPSRQPWHRARRPGGRRSAGLVASPVPVAEC